MIISLSAYFSYLALRLPALVAIISVSACQPANTTPIDIPSPPKATPKAKPTISYTESPAQPSESIKAITQAPLAAKLHKIEHNGIQFSIVTFDTRSQHLIVADQPQGPGSKWRDAESAAKANNGIAAINAGFFTPEGKPLGIVIAGGEQRGMNNTSSLGSGIFYHSPSGKNANIARRSVWPTLSKNPPRQLLQSGPMLLERSKPISGLSNKNERPRSFIATDGKSHWCIGHADSCTLAKLSDALHTITIPRFKPSTALNLDGGRSSDLWVSSTLTPENTSSHTIRPFWNKPVRNFLILKNN